MHNKYIKSCDVCLRNKLGPHLHRDTLLNILAEGPFDRVGVDTVGPFPEIFNGNRFILGYIDYLTKYAITAAVPDITATTIVRVFVNKVFCLVGPPRVLLSDREKNYCHQSLARFANF